MSHQPPKSPAQEGPPQQHAGWGIALRCGAMLGFAIVSAQAKWIGEKGIPIFELIFFRNAFALLPLCIYIWRTSGFGVLRTKRVGGHFARSTIGLMGMGFGFAAVQHLPLTDATAFNFAAPLFMTAMSAVLLKEVVGWHRWAAVVVGFIGVMIMATPEPGNFNLLGVSFALASAVGSAGAMVAIRQISSTETGPTIVFYYTLMGMAAGALGSMFHWVTPDLETLAMLAAIGVTGGVAQMLLTEALRKASIGIIAPFDYTQLIWAALIGLLIWDEHLRAATLFGALLVAGSGAYILHRELMKFRKG